MTQTCVYLTLTLSLLCACGVSDRKVSVRQPDAGAQEPDAAPRRNEVTPPEGGKSGNGTTVTGRAGSESGSPASGSGGAAGDSGSACSQMCTGDKPFCIGGQCIACLPASRRCAPGDVPEACEEAKWVAKSPCGGATPACSQGVCGSVRLSAALITVGSGVLGDKDVKLVDHGFEYQPSNCGSVKGNLMCVTGSFRP